MRRLWLLWCVGVPLLAAKQGAIECGTEPGRAQQEMFLHHRSALKRAQIATRAADTGINQDDGSIAVMDDSGGVIARRNLFDLDRKTLTFTPSGAGYQLTLGGDTFDTAAAQAGSFLKLGDDDTQQIALPFAFSYFGQTYRTAWVNSNGSVTFGRGDVDYTGSYGHFLAGPAVLAAAFTDLDPPAAAQGAGVFVKTEASRVVVSWYNVPLAGSSGFAIPPLETFQIRIYADGHFEFTYRISNLPSATVGITPGNLAAASLMNFSSAPAGAMGPVAEVFSNIDAVDVVYAAQKFYRTHEDAYDYLVFYNAESVAAGSGVVAYEMTVRSSGKGYGDTATDLGQSFGSPRRLQAVLNLGPVSQYPGNPNAQVAARYPTPDTPLTILAHEAGHLFLALVSVPNPFDASDQPMLGRARVHWAFPFHSDASFLEGNRIRDDGAGVSPRFTTTDAVSQYAELDQYLMGLRAPSEVSPTFVVLNSGQAEAQAPQTGVSFGGTRLNVKIEDVIAAAGRRVPDSTVAQRTFRMAIVLIVPAGSNLSDGGLIQNAIAQVDRYRTEFEPYYATATGGRGTIDTSLRSSVGLSLAPSGGVVLGAMGVGVLQLSGPAPSAVTFSLRAPAGVILTPAAATIAAGASRATFPIYGNRVGVEEFTAVPSDTRYETGIARVQVSPAPALGLSAVSGDRQVATGAALQNAIVARVVDANALGYSNVTVTASTASGSVTPASVATDEFGDVVFQWSPGAGGGVLELNTGSSTARVFALGPPSATAVVNGASFTSPLAPESFATIQGKGFAPGLVSAASSPFPTTLAGVIVSLNGTALPLEYVSDTQVNFLTPANLSPGSLDLTITTPAGTVSVQGQVQEHAPGIFFESATGYGAVLIAGTSDVTQVHPARAEDYLEVYGTGFGSLSGQSITASVAGLPAPVIYAGETAIPGLYQVDVQVPQGAAAGRQALSLTIAGVESNTVFVQVAN